MKIPHLHIIRLLLPAAAVLCLLPSMLLAQTGSGFNFKQTDKQLDIIEAGLNQKNIPAAEIAANLKAVNTIQADANQSKNFYTDKLQNIQKRLDALGAAPANGTKEPAEIAAKRKEFNTEEESYKAKIAQIELINARIDDINALILKVRNQSLFDKILVRQTSVFQFKEFGSSLLSFGVFIYNIAKSPYNWFTTLDQSQKQTVKDNIGYAAGILAAVLAFSVWLSIYIRQHFGYRECSANPARSQKIKSAIAMAFSYGVIPAAAIGAFILWFNDTEAVNFDNQNIGLLLRLAAAYLLAYFLIRAAIKVIFVPKCGFWRIINMEDNKARAVSRALNYAAAAVLTTRFLLQFAVRTQSADEIVYSLRILAVAANAFAIIIATRRLLYKPEDYAEPANDDNYRLSPAAKTSLAVTVFIGLAFLLSLAGYVRLSEYLIGRFVLSAAAAGIFWLVYKIIRIIIRQILLFKFWKRKLHINPRFLVKTEFWSGLALIPVLWASAVIAILGIWGFSVDIMLHDIKNFLLGFNIGGMHISIVSIFMGLLAFMVSMFVFKSLKRSLLYGQLSKIDMEEDSRNSLAAGISLIGFIISIIVAIAVMGGSLSSIAIIAGALSFGVGLGLQNIVSNFVSGIIIIFERPIKIGDWVVINGQEGIVKSISMRATLLEAFNKSDVIIPNSDILSSSLINMTYSNRIGRIEIKIGVNYNSNAKLVQDTLVNIASSTAGVLSNPAPSVAFVDFADNSLIFQLNCFTANVYNRQGIANQIREKILSGFASQSIGIPATQKIVQILSPLPEDNSDTPKKSPADVKA